MFERQGERREATRQFGAERGGGADDGYNHTAPVVQQALTKTTQ